ncbi:MAG: hypothetical protein R3F11_30260 [Verrucomicrobiales bacterium]
MLREKLNRLLGEGRRNECVSPARLPMSVESLADYRVAGAAFGTSACAGRGSGGAPAVRQQPDLFAARYTRFCQTSGMSTAQPMAVVDTPESWASMLRCWQQVFAAAGAQPGQDRAFFAFSFGPSFLGFWTAFEAAHLRWG